MSTKFIVSAGHIRRWERRRTSRQPSSSLRRAEKDETWARELISKSRGHRSCFAVLDYFFPTPSTLPSPVLTLFFFFFFSLFLSPSSIVNLLHRSSCCCGCCRCRILLTSDLFLYRQLLVSRFQRGKEEGNKQLSGSETSDLYDTPEIK
ncbi:hypothetical protein LY78DRAFT_177264 [Colletotrichum sublineola]|nr:hypothetical protein LY78DRAFT_177264 [Colletotrichum sublineola]